MKKIIYLACILLSVLACSTLAQRIRVVGNKFYVGEKEIFMLGVNTPWHKWNDFGHGFDNSWWDKHFAELHSYGINCTRVWISCDGRNSSPAISAEGKISQPTAQFWTDVGKLFEIAKKNQIYLMIALISFDHTKADNADRWKKMYSSAENRQSFVDNYALPFVEKFGSNPWFWAIDVGNELDWVFENHGVNRSDVFDLVARVANAVHSKSEVLVTLGTGAGPKYISPVFGTNWYSDTELAKLQSGARLDFYNIHYYDWMKEWFSTPFDKSPRDWQINEKPCIIGEYAAKGHGNGYSPKECLEKAFKLGWRGVMPWTSNGVDANGSLSDFGSDFKTWSNSNRELVFPSVVEHSGPFTITIKQSQGGTISLEPNKTLYNKGEKVTVKATANEGMAFKEWSEELSGTTNPITITINRNMNISAIFTVAGELLVNGNFEDGLNGWSLGQGPSYGNSLATAKVENGACKISISSPGTDVWHVQLIQSGLSFEQGKTYTLKFDASANAERTIFVAVGESGGEYRKLTSQTISLSTELKNFSIVFTASISISNGRVEFNVGTNQNAVIVDNVSIVQHSDTNAKRGILRPKFTKTTTNSSGHASIYRLDGTSVERHALNAFGVMVYTDNATRQVRKEFFHPAKR